jgi:hypothetical protein
MINFLSSRLFPIVKTVLPKLRAEVESHDDDGFDTGLFAE